MLTVTADELKSDHHLGAFLDQNQQHGSRFLVLLASKVQRSGGSNSRAGNDDSAKLRGTPRAESCTTRPVTNSRPPHHRRSSTSPQCAVLWWTQTTRNELRTARRWRRRRRLPLETQSPPLARWLVLTKLAV